MSKEKVNHQKEHPRIKREKRTMQAMVQLYCKNHHHLEDGLCEDCSDMLEYAQKRLDHCPFQENKTTCAKCSIHCYEPQKREKTRTVMRYSGPRMIWQHPIMAIQHLLNGRKKLKKESGKLKSPDSLLAEMQKEGESFLNPKSENQSREDSTKN